MAILKINKGEILNKVEATQIKKDLPNFGPGDTIVLHNQIVEGKKTRIQKFEGIVLRRVGSGSRETAIVRKESNGNYVEMNVDLNSPLIQKIEVKKYGKVRRAYISYMRQRSGKSARIKEKLSKKK